MRPLKISAIKKVLASTAILVLCALIHVPSEWPIASFIQSVPLSVYIILTLLALSAVAVWFERFGISIAVLAIAISWTSALFQLHSAAAFAASMSPSLSVVTYNTEYWDQGENEELFFSELKSLRSDILILQEHVYWDASARHLIPINKTEQLKACCNYTNVWSKGELVIASDYPGTVISTDDDYVLAVSIEVRGQTLTIIDVHVPVHVDVGLSPFSSAFWRYIAARNDQRLRTENVLRHVLTSSTAAIVGGDFNSTVLMPSLRRTLFGTTDFRLTDLWLPTYPAHSHLPELWRLDFLLGKNSGTRQCNVLRRSPPLTSDHWPVRCTFGTSS